jgi:O-antigen/teichoic acid export membrane protein
MDVLRYIIGRDYWEGLRVVPIVIAAEIMMGIYFNLSFWYKLIDKTIWGAWFSGIGCAVLVTVNIVFVPRYGYMACAWGGFAGYLTCMVLSYLVGQKKNTISYPMRDILFYLGLTLIFFIGMKISNEQLPMWGALGVNTLIILFFAAVVAKKDLRLPRKA